MSVPSDISIQYEAKPSDETIEAAAEMYVRMMRNRATFLAAVSGNMELAPFMSVGVIKPLVLIAGEMYTAKDENDTLVGFTIWVPPGRSALDSPEQLEMGFSEFLSRMDEEGRKFQEETIGQIVPHFVDQSLGIEKAEDNAYWCWFAMVQEEHQGKGLCRKMFEMVFEKAASMGAPMALLTDDTVNVAIYEKLGFTLRGQQNMISPWSEWMFYCMSREACKK